MTLWEVLAKFKSEIPDDFRPWRVDRCYDYYTGKGYFSISTTYYRPGDLGWIDEPMSIYRKYGVYSTKEKAITAAREFNSSYKIDVYD